MLTLVIISCLCKFNTLLKPPVTQLPSNGFTSGSQRLTTKTLVRFACLWTTCVWLALIVVFVNLTRVKFWKDTRCGDDTAVRELWLYWILDRCCDKALLMDERFSLNHNKRPLHPLNDYYKVTMVQTLLICWVFSYSLWIPSQTMINCRHQRFALFCFTTPSCLRQHIINSPAQASNHTL